MRIVIDTNIVISAVFFGGNPRKILNSVLRKNAAAYATKEIVDEYDEIKLKMINVKHKIPKDNLFDQFVENLKIVETKT